MTMTKMTRKMTKSPANENKIPENISSSFHPAPMAFCDFSYEPVILWFLDIPLLSGINRAPGLGSPVAPTLHAPDRFCKHGGGGCICR